jgi:hypothetical protein
MWASLLPRLPVDAVGNESLVGLGLPRLRRGLASREFLATGAIRLAIRDRFARPLLVGISPDRVGHPVHNVAAYLSLRLCLHLDLVLIDTNSLLAPLLQPVNT